MIRFVILIMTGTMVLLASCLKDMPEALPEHIEWNAELALPIGSGLFGIDAADGFDSTWLEFDTITSFPNWIDEDSITLRYRLEFDLSSINESIDDMNQILFRINFDNGFPNELMAQCYFLDPSDNQVDSMFTSGPIPVPAGRILGNGETVDPSHIRQDVVFDQDRVIGLADVTQLEFQAIIRNLSQIDSTLYPYYPSYEFGAEIGIMVDLTISY